MSYNDRQGECREEEILTPSAIEIYILQGLDQMTRYGWDLVLVAFVEVAACTQLLMIHYLVVKEVEPATILALLLEQDTTLSDRVMDHRMFEAVLDFQAEGLAAAVLVATRLVALVVGTSFDGEQGQRLRQKHQKK